MLIHKKRYSIWLFQSHHLSLRSVSSEWTWKALVCYCQQLIALNARCIALFMSAQTRCMEALLNRYTPSLSRCTGGFWEVTGVSCQQVFDETSPLMPDNPYSATKAAAEIQVLSYWEKHKVDTGTHRIRITMWRLRFDVLIDLVSSHHHSEQQHLRPPTVHWEGKVESLLTHHFFKLHLNPPFFLLQVIPRFISLLQHNKKWYTKETTPHFHFKGLLS